MAGLNTTDCRGASEHYTGTPHTVWIGAEYVNPDNPVPSTETLTTSGVTAIGTNVTITLSAATTNKYYKGQRIRFGAAGSYKVVELAADADVGSTTLVAKEVLTEIPDADTAIEIPMVPYWSVRATAPTVEGETLEIRNAGACDWATKVMLKRMHTNSLSGAQVRNDPGLSLLKSAACTTINQVFIRIIKSDDTAWEGNYWVRSWNHPHETDTAVNVEFQLEGDSSPDEDTEYAVA